MQYLDFEKELENLDIQIDALKLTQYIEDIK